MKQIPIIAILCFILFDATGVYLFSEYGLHKARMEARVFTRSRSKAEDLITLIVPKSRAAQITWLERNEFRYEGEMYDVVKVFDDGFQTIYTCYHDKKEKEVMAAFSRKLDDNKDNASSSQSSVPGLKQLDKYFSGKDILIMNTFITTMVINLEISSPLNLFSPSIPTPPPNFG